MAASGLRLIGRAAFPRCPRARGGRTCGHDHAGPTKAGSRARPAASSRCRSRCPSRTRCSSAVETASVCGTDLHIYALGRLVAAADHPAAHARPRVRGHGRRDRPPASARSQPGDYVSAESHVTCGVCFHCRTGHAHMCERTQILGVDRDGAFARYVAVPESVIWKNDRTKLPPEIATLQEPFGNAVFATERAGSRRPLGRRARLRARRAVHDRDRARLGRGRRARGRPHRLPARPRRDDGRERGRQRRRRRRTRRAGSSSTTRASASTSSSRCPARRARSRTRSASRATAAASILFGIPSRPVEIDVAESLIFKNLERARR